MKPPGTPGPTGTLAFQRAMQRRNPDSQLFTTYFGDRLPVRGMREAGPLTPEELRDRAEVVAEGRARVLDSWNPEDMLLLNRVIDMAAKGLYRILTHQPYQSPGPQPTEPGRPPRLCIYLVWLELCREIKQTTGDVPWYDDRDRTQVVETEPRLPGVDHLFPSESYAHVPPADT